MRSSRQISPPRYVNSRTRSTAAFASRQRQRRLRARRISTTIRKAVRHYRTQQRRAPSPADEQTTPSLNAPAGHVTPQFSGADKRDRALRRPSRRSDPSPGRHGHRELWYGGPSEALVSFGATRVCGWAQTELPSGRLPLSSRARLHANWEASTGPRWNPRREHGHRWCVTQAERYRGRSRATGKQVVGGGAGLIVGVGAARWRPARPVNV